jgi:thioredoxin reductase (NADPH)
MLVRGNALRSTGPEARIITDHPDVEIIYNTRIESIESEDGKITKVVTSGDFAGEIETDGVFIAIGSDPASGFLSDSVVMRDSEGYVKVLGDSTRIQGGVPGVYAAGDVADKVYRQAITSAGKGVQAALEARHYLNTPVPEVKKSR